MDDSVTASILFQRYQQRLDLQWSAGREGGQRPLGHGTDGASHSLIGYLNVIHPSRLQLLGPLELGHLNSIDSESRRQLVEQLCASQPAAVFVTDAQSAPDDLRECCEQTRTPLFLSTLHSSKLLNCLRHYLDDELAEKAVVHGVFMEVHGMGVLLTGESSVGKSELALELITRKHRLIADDAPEFSRVGPDTVRGRCPEVLRDFLEVRGLGVLNVRAMYGDSAIKMSKDLRLVVKLQRLSESDMQQLDRLNGGHRRCSILDVEIPEVTLPVASGRNLAVLVEAAVRDHILLRKGYNAGEAFSRRQRELMQMQTRKDPKV
jgi:HPr kinase/phosphorylase